MRPNRFTPMKNTDPPGQAGLSRQQKLFGLALGAVVVGLALYLWGFI